MRNDFIGRYKMPALGEVSSRGILQIIVVFLLLAAVALTIMPILFLAALADATVWAREMAIAYRPVVAFIGLLLVGGLTLLLLTLRRQPVKAADGMELPVEDRDETLRPAA